MMKTIVSLQREHARFQQLLRLVEKQLAALQRGTTPDYELLQDGLDALDYYLDGVHQPLEQQLLDKVLKHLSRHRDLLVPLITQDQMEFDRQYTAFRDTLRSGLSDCIVSRRELTQFGSAAVAGLRRQIGIEEHALFPLAAELLHEQDWHDIEANLGLLKGRCSSDALHPLPRSGTIPASALI